MIIRAGGMHFEDLCRKIREAGEDVLVENCQGQRYIGSGMHGVNIELYGTPGNALGAYFGDGRITVHGNAQDATGDTMDGGTIVIHGSSGDATGYAMRGGRILIRDNAGYRAGIHMKQYADKRPVLVIGGRTGSFLGEYQAGGLILVLGLHTDGRPIVGEFCGTGMHGGRIVLRCDAPPTGLPRQVMARQASAEDLEEIVPLMDEFCSTFDIRCDMMSKSTFFILTPDSRNPYQQLYVYN
ncbi:MAG: glutamate synthase [Oscillospiraceae bacterium]|jgi:glutamate synthase domain-containing protein 3|nr:glutamate synthase [Oscillospiraceae bacterium]